MKASLVEGQQLQHKDREKGKEIRGKDERKPESGKRWVTFLISVHT